MFLIKHDSGVVKMFGKINVWERGATFIHIFRCHGYNSNRSLIKTKNLSR